MNDFIFGTGVESLSSVNVPISISKLIFNFKIK